MGRKEDEYRGAISLLDMTKESPRMQEIGVISLFGVADDTDKMFSMAEALKETQIFMRNFSAMLSFVLRDAVVLSVMHSWYYPKGIASDIIHYDLEDRKIVTSEEIDEKYGPPVYVNSFYPLHLIQYIMDGLAKRIGAAPVHKK